MATGGTKVRSIGINTSKVMNLKSCGDFILEPLAPNFNEDTSDY